jgi:hypothetical protein
VRLTVEEDGKANDAGKQSGGGEGHIRNIEVTYHVNLLVIGRKEVIFASRVSRFYWMIWFFYGSMLRSDRFIM